MTGYQFGKPAVRQLARVVKASERQPRNSRPPRARWHGGSGNGTGANGDGDCCCCPEPHVSVTACCPCLPPIVCVTAPGEDDESDTDDISSLGELSESGASYTVSVLCQSGNSIMLTLNAMVNPARPGVCMFRVTSTCDPEWEAWIDLPCAAFQSMDDGTSPFLAETAVTVPCEDCPETLLIRWPRLIKCLVCSTCFGLPVRLCLLVTFTTAAGFTYRNTIRLKWSLTEKAWLPEDPNATTFIYGTGETETTVTHNIRVVPDAMGCKLLVFVNDEYEAREYTIPPESCTSWSYPFSVDIPPNPLESLDEEWTLSPMFCDELCVIAPATCLDDYPCITAADTLHATAGPVPGMFCTMTITDEPAVPVDGVWSWEITGPEGSTTVSLECRYGRNEGGNFVADDAAPPLLVLVQTGCGVPGAEAVLIFEGGCTGDDFVISVGLYSDNTCCEGMGFPSLEITITNIAP